MGTITLLLGDIDGRYRLKKSIQAKTWIEGGFTYVRYKYESSDVATTVHATDIDAAGRKLLAALVKEYEMYSAIPKPGIVDMRMREDLSDLIERGEQSADKLT